MKKFSRGCEQLFLLVILIENILSLRKLGRGMCIIVLIIDYRYICQNSQYYVFFHSQLFEMNDQVSSQIQVSICLMVATFETLLYRSQLMHSRQ